MPGATLLIGLSIGVASLLASYAVRLSNRRLRVVAVTLIAAPGLALLIVMLVLFYRMDNRDLFSIAGLAAFWLLPVAAGVQWRASDRPTTSLRSSRWLLPVLPVAIAVCIAGVNVALVMSDRARRRQQEQSQLKRHWALDERRLASCARTLNATVGQRDAVRSANLGDRRLLGTYEIYQEGSRFYVPVLDVSDEGRGGPASPPLYVDARVVDARVVDARIGVERLPRRIYAKVSPKGEIWGDPWGWVEASMGRVPDSAAACTKATGNYIRAYNEAMLRIGAASAPIAIHSRQ